MKELVYPRLLLQRAEQLADKVAFIDVSSTGIRYQGTFENHMDRLVRLANSMRDVLGLKPGDRFAVLAANSHQYIELYHAAMFGAGIINPLNIRFAPSELAYVLNDSGSKVVFTDASFASLLDRARGAGALVDTVVMIDGESETAASPDDSALLSDTKTWWRSAARSCRPSRMRTTPPF